MTGRSRRSSAASTSGPAPVSLDAFREQVEKQRITRERVGPERITRSFAHLVLPEDLLARLGPAVNSGKSILLYGRSGNGKTAIAEALRDAFDDVVAVPYAIAVGGQIINYFDAHVHQVVPGSYGDELNEGFGPGGTGAGSPAAGRSPWSAASSPSRCSISCSTDAPGSTRRRLT